ncbi:MAG: type IX secretion system outer membrane channel protein PorV [Flavobacteriales bacterium]|nr:type IX secretion system outer membrane channel protein PorV [Flavobacteriales bacterium]
MKYYLHLVLACLAMVPIGTLAQTGAHVNSITTSVSLLSVNRNPIAGGMGEIGVVSSAYNHEPGLFNNPALLSRNSVNNSLHFTYSPWLRALLPGMQDFNLSASYSLDSANTLGLTVDYFDLGKLLYTNIVSRPLSLDKAYDFYIDLRYGRTVNKNISLGAGIKYFKRDLGKNPRVLGTILNLQPIQSIAVDLGLDHRLVFRVNSEWTARWSNGLSINNIGPKVSYFPDLDDSDFIPTTLNLGTMITLSNNGKEYGKPITLEIDVAYQVSKLLVPTPPLWDVDSMGLPIGIASGVDSENFTVFEGILSSFSDAPNGTQEELQEIIHQIGIEFRLIADEFKIALRSGSFLEHFDKGGRRYQTFGIGIQWKTLSFDTSYILPYATRHPLDHTFRFSVGYHFL